MSPGGHECLTYRKAHAHAAVQPLIVIGMHRSGTSVVMRCLEAMGIFCGAALDDNHEPWFFANLNNWLMRQVGAEWDCPQPAIAYLKHPELAEWSAQRLRDFLTSPRSWLFLGARRALTARHAMALHEPWGWKDPRNTLTLPVWARVFPDAKVLVVHRHGMDVAESLRVRASRMLGESKRRRADWWSPRPLAATNSARCLDLKGGLALWHEYVTLGEQALRSSGLRHMAIRFEELMEAPSKGLRDIASFAGADVNDTHIERIVGTLRKERAFGYRATPSLVEFAHRNASTLAAEHYEP